MSKGYGKRTFIGCCIFSAVTILAVLYDEHLQRERRQVNVVYRLNQIHQKENMAEYETQRQRGLVQEKLGE